MDTKKILIYSGIGIIIIAIIAIIAFIIISVSNNNKKPSTTKVTEESGKNVKDIVEKLFGF